MEGLMLVGERCYWRTRCLAWQAILMPLHDQPHQVGLHFSNVDTCGHTGSDTVLAGGVAVGKTLVGPYCFSSLYTGTVALAMGLDGLRHAGKTSPARQPRGT
jgi:hypothetical protein